MPLYLALLIFLLVAAGNFGGMIALTSLLGPKQRNPVKDEPFECGSIPVGGPSGKIHVRFYMVAMLFIVFDIETVMMYPWAVIYLKDLRLFGLGEMAVFVALLTFGLVYVWKRGGLEWD
jgi:NADH-quinone oxidoreductase subunit A